MLIRLHTVYGCFHVTVAELVAATEMAPKAENIYFSL